MPLRISIISKVTDTETLTRQWNAVSEQPIVLQMTQPENLLQQSKCSADLLVYPSYMLGDLNSRGWLVRLPSQLRPLIDPPTDQDDPIEYLPPPASMLTAATYGSDLFGLPIGHSMINLISNQPDQTNVSWDRLNDLLAAVEVRPLEFDEQGVDAIALADRWLYLIFGTTQLNTKYGVLFDIRSLNPKVELSAFSMASNQLQRLACQQDAAISVVGSHNDAWEFCNGKGERPVFALANSSQLSLEAMAIESVSPIAIEGFNPWNSGSGLLISISSECRQTAQSIQFIQWLARQKTLDSLKGLVEGLGTTGAQGRSPADRLLASTVATLQNDQVPLEPRMPGAFELKRSLANQLVRFLRGTCSAEEAWKETTSLWKQQMQGQPKAKFEYETSLGIRT